MTGGQRSFFGDLLRLLVRKARLQHLPPFKRQGQTVAGADRVLLSRGKNLFTAKVRSLRRFSEGFLGVLRGFAVQISKPQGLRGDFNNTLQARKISASFRRAYAMIKGLTKKLDMTGTGIMKE